MDDDLLPDFDHQKVEDEKRRTKEVRRALLLAVVFASILCLSDKTGAMWLILSLLLVAAIPVVLIRDL